MRETKLPESISKADILEFIDRVRPKIYPPYKHLNPFDSDLALEIIKQLQTVLAEAKEDDSEGTTPLAVLEQIVRLQAELEKALPFVEAVKKRHNGYDPDACKAMEMTTPATPEIALQDLQDGWDAIEDIYAKRQAELEVELDKLRWIPVGEGLPKHAQDVWVCVSGDKTYAWATKDSWHIKEKRWLNSGYSDLNITHWMDITLPSENKDE